MAGGGVQKVQNGLSALSLGGATTKSDQMSTTNGSTNGSSKHGGDNVSSIEIVDVSNPTHHRLYNVLYKDAKIRTTVTHRASVVDEWIADVYTKFRSKLNNLVVGLDIEWKRIRDGSTRNKVAVLQLCLSHDCLIFQITCCRDEIPDSLYDFLGNEKFTFVGVGIYGDAHKLLVDHGLDVAKTEELGSLAAFKLTKTFKDYRNSPCHEAGLKQLANDVLGWVLPKDRKIQLSKWDSSLLSDDQIKYACLDAFVSYKLAINLMGRANPLHTKDTKKKFLKVFSKQEEAKQ